MSSGSYFNEDSGASATDGIVNNDQGFYQNTGAATINQLPILEFAYVSNTCKEHVDPATVVLNTRVMSWADFTTLFFCTAGGAFSINLSNNNSSAICLASQLYTTTQTKNMLFSLGDQIRKAWSKKFDKPIIAISSKTNIDISRLCFLAKSLVVIVKTSTGLSLDECISTLLSNGQIVVGDVNSEASVMFSLKCDIYYEPLDVTVSIIFPYLVKIPCYDNATVCPPYSSTCCPARQIFDDQDFSDSASIASGDISTAGTRDGINQLISGAGTETVCSKGTW